MKNLEKFISSQSEVVVTGKQVIYITIKSENRNQTRDELEAALKKDRIKYTRVETAKSGFFATQLTLEEKKTNIIYKPLKGGGSGAGAAVTKTGESAQCLYASYSFNVKKGTISDKDITAKGLEKALKWAITDESKKVLLEQVPDDWVKSAILGANKLKKEFNGSYEFHRGSQLVGKIENTLKKINKKEKAFGNLNKWSPADIYMVHKSFDVRVVESATTLIELNKIMHDELANKRLIGVSLKKIETTAAKLSYKNIKTTKKPEYVYKGYSIKNIESIDSYIETNNGKMQFRSFSGTKLSGWQGEGKGKYANQGKISLGPINYILQANGIKPLPTNSAQLARSNTRSHAQKFLPLLKYVDGSVKHVNVEWIMNQTDAWRYSKYLSLLIVDRIAKLPQKKRNKVVAQLFLYSASQTDYSAPYAKLE
jgi:hypothetical protein